MKNKLRVGILGATGMVGQRFITLLEKHPWFKVTSVAASPNSSGKPYIDAVQKKWKIAAKIPRDVKDLTVKAVEEDIDKIVKEVDFVLCALDMDSEKIREVEVKYARAGIPVVSNNSAHRWVEDIPMIIPEVNPTHVKLIDIQKKNRGWKKGFIAVKPNCSIQSYVAILTALKEFIPYEVEVVSFQAISGAGKTFDTWPEMKDNIIPLISKEEEKSEKEPMKIWGSIRNGKLHLANKPTIAATCIRVPVTDGHMVNVAVNFKNKPTRKKILFALKNFQNPIAALNLPSAPKEFIKYFTEDNRPQTQLDRTFENGMGITMGRLREDKFFDWKFIALSHNTIRGAAGGAILMAELLKSNGYIG